MPGIQFLGTEPRKTSPIADVIKAGVKPGIAAFEKAQQRGVDLAKISHNKKKQAADLITKAAENATPQQREKLFEEGGETANLINDVYGAEALNTLRQVGGKGISGKLAKAGTWIARKSKPSPTTGLTLPLGRAAMDTSIALELSDTNWRVTYPDLAAKFDVAYPTTTVTKKDKGFFGRFKKINYGELSEQELFDKAVAGDAQAIQEAIRRGFPIGGAK